MWKGRHRPLVEMRKTDEMKRKPRRLVYNPTKGFKRRREKGKDGWDWIA